MAVAAENLLLTVVKETTPGTTPANPAWTECPLVSESIAPDPTFTESDMIRGGTRGVTDVTLTQMATAGDISRELAYEDVTKILLETLLGNTWGTDPHTNGIGANQLYDYVTLVPVSVEKRWEIDPTPEHNYHWFRGNVAASGSIDFAPGEIITHNTTFVGLNYEVGDDPVAGATYVPPVGNPPMSAPKVTSMVLTIPGTETPVSWMNAACFTQLSLAFENNSRAIACIGSLQAREIVLGRLNMTATGSIYYNADEPLEALLLEPEYGLLIDAEDSVGNSYKFWCPRVKFTSADVVATGQSTDVMTNFTLTCLQDPDLKFTIQIEEYGGSSPIGADPSSGDGTTEITIQLTGGPRSDAAATATPSITVTGSTPGAMTPVVVEEGDTIDTVGQLLALEFQNSDPDLTAGYNLSTNEITITATGAITSIDTAAVAFA